jgi:hypothetical protein
MNEEKKEKRGRPRLDGNIKKKIGISLKVDVDFAVRMENRWQELGFDSCSAYLRYLVDADIHFAMFESREVG